MKIEKLQNVMTSMAMLERMAGNLPFRMVFMTKAEQEATNRLYAENAKTQTPSLDVHRLHRENSAGVTQADGGYLKFGKDGQKAVCPRYLVADLTKQGYRLIDALILKKEGDVNERGEQRVHLRFYWALNAAKVLHLNEEQQDVARDWFNKPFHMVFGYFNPAAASLQGDSSPIKGSIVTLNFSGVMNAQSEQNRADEIREIRMTDQAGHLACPLRKPATAGTVVTTPIVPDRREAPRWCPERPSEEKFRPRLISLTEAYDKGCGENRGEKK